MPQVVVVLAQVVVLLPPAVPVRVAVRGAAVAVGRVRERLGQARLLVERDGGRGGPGAVRGRDAVRRRVPQLVGHLAQVVVEEGAGERAAGDEVDEVVVREVLRAREREDEGQRLGSLEVEARYKEKGERTIVLQYKRKT